MGQQLWMDTLQEDLGNEYQVIKPAMPNKTNANYDEWAIWFGRVIEQLDDDSILIGHSMGGIFLPKYLSEHTVPRPILATILIAAPYEDESDEDLTNFKITGPLDQFVKQAGKIIFFHGSDDMVPLSELELYEKAIPGVETHVQSAPDHFMRPRFPELIDRLKQL